MKTATPPKLARHKTAPGRARQDPLQMDDTQLIARVFALSGQPGECLQLADQSLSRYGSLQGLVCAAARNDDAQASAPSPLLDLVRVMHELFRRQMLEKLQHGQALTSPAETVEFLRLSLEHRRREIFMCIFLDTRHRVISSDNLFLGSIDGASVYPRVVAEHALRLNAAAVIVAHNHPSGVAEPSLADQAITRRLKEALALLEIRLLDHFIVGHEEPVSMASRGMV